MDPQRPGMVPKSLIATDATAGRITMNKMNVFDKTLQFELLKRSCMNGMIMAKLTNLQMMEGTLIKSLMMSRTNVCFPSDESLATQRVALTVNGAVKSVVKSAMVNDLMTTGKVLISGPLLLFPSPGP